MKTCVVCGHGTKEDRAETPVYSLEECPHDVIDRRSGQKDVIMFCCKQSCTHSDCRSRAEVMVQDRVNDRMLAASTAIQTVAGRFLEKRDLAKVEVDKLYAIFGAKLRQHMADKEIIAQSKIVKLLL